MLYKLEKRTHDVQNFYMTLENKVILKKILSRYQEGQCCLVAYIPQIIFLCVLQKKLTG